jgi:hypothetical protein
MSACLSLSASVCQSTYLYVCLAFCLSFCSSTCLSVCMSVCLFYVSPVCIPPLLYMSISACFRPTHRVHILVKMKQGQCLCPFSWSVHCNFIGEGKCNERGWACTPHPHQQGLILPSSLNVRQKAVVATLCTLWSYPSPSPLSLATIQE